MLINESVEYDDKVIVELIKEETLATNDFRRVINEVKIKDTRSFDKIDVGILSQLGDVPIEKIRQMLGHIKDKNFGGVSTK